jgi:hypothetical protein
VSVVCCQVGVSAKDRKLVQRSHTEGSVSEGDREASTMRRPWPTMGCCAMWAGGRLYTSRRAMNGVKLMEKSYSNIEMKQEERLSPESMR